MGNLWRAFTSSSSLSKVVLTDVELPVLLNLAQCVAMNMGHQGEPEAGLPETTGHQGTAAFEVRAAHGGHTGLIAPSLPGALACCF